ncbi:MAG: hypothetical protein N2645_03140 [Clostridia bacterium]|nr:hypothetical protein [Clostridia bacterium]
MKIRIWCEFVPPNDLCKDEIVGILKKYNVFLNYKVEYGKLNKDFFSMLKFYNDKNVPVSLWLTLADEDGYWINERNADKFDKYVQDVIHSIDERDLKVEGVCIDLEPSLRDVKNIWGAKNIFSLSMVYIKMLLNNISKKRFRAASEILRRTAEFLKAKGLESYATSLCYCYYDLKFKSDFMQNVLEVPFFEVPWEKYNMMYYSTLIRHELRREKINIDYLIYYQMMHLKEKLGDRLAVSIGLSNVGKLGNEPYYDNLNDLSKDVGLLKECGVGDISLFSLDGLMDVQSLEAFLSTIAASKPHKPQCCDGVLKREKRTKRLFTLGKVYYKFFGRF